MGHWGRWGPAPWGLPRLRRYEGPQTLRPTDGVDDDDDQGLPMMLDMQFHHRMPVLLFPSTSIFSTIRQIFAQGTLHRKILVISIALLCVCAFLVIRRSRRRIHATIPRPLRFLLVTAHKNITYRRPQSLLAIKIPSISDRHLKVILVCFAVCSFAKWQDA